MATCKVMATYDSGRVSKFFSLPKFHCLSHAKTLSLGGMAGAIITSPLDVVKTRLQSDMFQKSPALGKQREFALAGMTSSSAPTISIRPTGARGLLWNFVETGHILRYV